MSRRNVEAVYPLSPMQQGMIFHSLLAPESGMYIEQFRCVLRGNLNVEAFTRAWQQVVDRHSVLRTAFAWKRVEQMLQVVNNHVQIPFDTQDWRDLPSDEQSARLDSYILADRRRGFDLSKAPLLRLSLIRTQDDAYTFIWIHHHALVDGWSMPLILKEVLAFYEAFSQGRDLYMEPTRPYRDYINWLQHQDMDKAKAFWEEKLKGFRAPTPLRLDRRISNGDLNVDNYSVQTIKLSIETTTSLQSLARQNHLTISTLVQAAWAVLLSRYSGEEDVLFGATVSGRPADLNKVESMVGLFINTLPVRVHVDSDARLLDWLKGFQAQLAEIRQFEYTPLVQVQEWSEIERSSPLFESILVFENYPVEESIRSHRLSLRIENFTSNEQTNYPLTVVSAPGETLPIEIAYDRRRFDDRTIERILGHFATLLSGMAEYPEWKLGALPILTQEEQNQVLYKWNGSWNRTESNNCAQELFEKVVERNPDAVAIRFVVPGIETQQMKYLELNRRANQLAHYLKRCGVGPEKLVGICLERSLEMIVAIFGVLKAGGAYVPLDPSYPVERLEFMVEDTNLPVLITDSSLSNLFSQKDRKVIDLNSGWEEIAQEDQENPFCSILPENLAYIIYTSGSTGLPKGTLLQHRGLCNMAKALQHLYPLNAKSRVLQFSSFSFDGAVAEIFATLLMGGCLIISRKETLLSTQDLLKLLREEAITTMTMPPSMLSLLPADNLPDLITVVSAGEACHKEIIESWSPGRRFLNGYGPTETTVAATLRLMENVTQINDNIPIGRPVENLQAYILDRNLQPVPVGVPGELHIGGISLARGYLNRPEVTAEKFIPNPFVKSNGKSQRIEYGDRLYKTGDLARFCDNGEIEFIGRIDHQIKLRGFRIEIGEIEAVLTGHPSVKEAVLVVHEGQLVAYVVPSHDKDLQYQELRRYLKQTLPEYMIPATFVKMEVFPLSPSGKVDRRALPAPEGSRESLGSLYYPPRNPVEGILVEIWARLLKIDRVSIRDNFFDLGGHSLLATQLLSRIREAFKVELPLRVLFEKPTVADLAEEIDKSMRASLGVDAPPILPRVDPNEVPLSFAQQRLWFLDQLDPGNLFYNIPVAVSLKGNLNETALISALNEVVRRHESLRTTFKSVGGKPIQVITPTLFLEPAVEDLTNLPEAEREKEAKRRAQEETRVPFDLSRGPLFRARLLRLSEEEHVILLTMHHIISDGWSMNIFIQEIAMLYSTFSSGLPSMLPPLKYQYAEFAAWQRNWLQGEVLEKQLDYWKGQLGGHPMMLELPTDRPRPAVQTWNGATELFQIPLDLVKQLRALGREEGATLFMTLMGAFQTLLLRYTGQQDINIGTAVANRNRAEIEGLIGFFVNTLVMRTDLSGEPDFREVIGRVRETALGAYSHQDLPFEMLVEALAPQRDMSHTPLFQVAFALQNVPSDKVELPGITMSSLVVDSGTAKYDMTLFMGESEDGLRGALEYNSDLFDKTSIQRMIGHFRRLLEEIISAPDQPITRLSILTQDEARQILVDWNNTTLETPTDLCVHELFESQVSTRPGAIAVMFEDQGLTYASLNQYANQLARYLRQLGVGPEVMVGILTERSPEMIVGILGILKAGGAYLPVDPNYPPDRLAFMLEDSRVPVILTQSRLVERLPVTQARVIQLDKDWGEISKLEPTNLEIVTTPDNLAYIIYTSGSTGKPKGALLRHRGLSNLTAVQRDAFRIDHHSRILQFSPFSFDASVWETFMALANGATLCLARQEILASGADLVKLLRDKVITNITLPPSVLRVLPAENLPELQTVIAAGEACTTDLVARWAPGRNFFNAYGPTETTVCASMHLCDVKEVGAPPIGRPIGNTRLYILDQSMQPVPIGVVGELHVAGVSLAREYLHRPEMTSQKFIMDPFNEKAGERLYKTGDLARYRPDGNIEFLGRVDSQVKIRGFRIELGEIENALEFHSGVHEAVVIAREDSPGDRRLVAYIVPKASLTEIESGENNPSALLIEKPVMNVRELRSHLNQTLPEYMIPSQFVFLKGLPITPSGKVDRRALPAPELERSFLEREYVAPRSEIEIKLAKISCDLLGIQQVGIYDNFFDLGGHSLLATQFISRVREELNVELPLRSLFENPTIAGLSETVEKVQKIQTPDRAKILEMLARIEELSDEEVNILLEQKKALLAKGKLND